MAFTEIDIDATGQFSGQGRLPSELSQIIKDIKTIDLFKQLFAKFVELQRSYAQAMHLDKKLIGPERFELMDLLDDCLDLLISVRAKYQPDGVFVMEAPDLGRRLQIQIDFDRWKASGSLGTKRKLTTNQFTDWLKRMTQERLPVVLKYFGEISRDGILTPEELVGLSKLIDRLFFSAVIVREAVSSGEME
ncbi:MAG: hypothetical protein K8S54_09885 [Spirochaetia bacterium]|nr:hypothetical protein [Spirochaetia bacterium]